MNTKTMEQEIAEIVKRSDATTVKAALATLKAMLSGMDFREALEMGNVILVEGGRKPVLIEDVLAKMEEIRYGQVG